MQTTLATALTTRLATLPEPTHVDLWTFTIGATTYRWCDGAVDRTAGSYTWTCKKGAIKRGSVESAAGDQDGVSVDTMDVTITAEDTANVGSVAFDAAVLAGSFGGAVMLLTHLYLDDDGSQLGTVDVFGGKVQQVEPNTNEVKLVVKSWLCLSSEDVPRRKITLVCPYSFGDSDCGLTPSTTSGTIASLITGVGNGYIGFTYSGSVAPVAGERITFTSGAKSGKTRTVRSATVAAGVVTVTMASAQVGLVVGVTFTITTACDKTRAACIAYANVRRFGGFPDVPDKADSLMATST